MDTLRELFGRAAGNAALIYYRRNPELSPLERITKSEVDACVFFAIMSLALGGALPDPRLQLTNQGGK